jgi:hypothetical protein
MARADDREVPPVYCGDLCRMDPLSDGGHAGVGAPEWEAGIVPYELCHSTDVLRRDADHGPVRPIRQVIEERRFRGGTAESVDQVADLSQDGCGDEQITPALGSASNHSRQAMWWSSLGLASATNGPVSMRITGRSPR